MAVVARFDRDLERLMPTLDKNKVPYAFYSKKTRKEPAILRAFKAILCMAFRGGGLQSWKSILPLLSGVGDKSSKVILQLLQKNNYGLGAINQYVTSH